MSSFIIDVAKLSHMKDLIRKNKVIMKRCITNLKNLEYDLNHLESGINSLSKKYQPYHITNKSIQYEKDILEINHNASAFNHLLNRLINQYEC